MSSRRLRIKEAELKFLAFSEVYARLSQPKAQRQAFALLEAATACLARDGFRGVTLSKLAREAGVARSLLTHYFRDLDDILDCAIKYIRLLFQRLAIRAMEKGATPRQMFERYLDACFDWVTQFRAHALVWLSFLHLCAGRRSKRALNDLAVRAGFERLGALLEAGRAAGQFACADPTTTASLIQNLITGGLVCHVSESHADLAAHRQCIRETCLNLVGIAA